MNVPNKSIEKFLKDGSSNVKSTGINYLIKKRAAMNRPILLFHVVFKLFLSFRTQISKTITAAKNAPNIQK